MTPAQLDAHIASLGMALADAHAHGDTEGARAKLAEMHAAIRSRTPEHQADFDPCYSAPWARLTGRGF